LAVVVAGVLGSEALGCAGRARVELAAADALDALAGELGRALAEYREDLERADDGREQAVVAAFVARTRRDHADDAAMAAHADAFGAALARVRADRRVAWARYDAARENVGLAQEVARDLRGFALEGLALDEEARAYLRRVLEARRDAQAGEAAGQAAEPAVGRSMVTGSAEEGRS